MWRFRHGMAVVLVCFLSQAGIMLAVEADAHVRGAVLFPGTAPEAKTMRVTADTELFEKETRIQIVQVKSIRL